MPVAPATNQFGLPTVAPTNQFGLPATAPVRAPVAPEVTGTNWGKLAAVGGAVVLAVGAFVWLQGVGKKTSNKVANTVETPIVKAHQTAEVADLQQAVQSEETYLADHNGYASSVSQLTGFVSSPTTKVTVVSATATTYCLRADDLSTFHAPPMFVSSASAAASTTPCT